jgi:hypothetical protein
MFTLVATLVTLTAQNQESDSSLLMPCLKLDSVGLECISYSFMQMIPQRRIKMWFGSTDA